MEDSVIYVVRVERIPLAASAEAKHAQEPRTLLKRPANASANGKASIALPPRNAWLFQSNPVLYDLRGALRLLKEQVWSVSRYAKEVKPGDRVYLWEAGRQGGIAAVAEISEPVRIQPEPAEQLPFARDAAAFAGDRVRVRLRILTVIEPLIARQTILFCPGLSALDVLRCSRGTNFRLSVGESFTIDSLIQPGTQSAAA